MTTKPGFDLEKIKSGTDKATFERGVKLYEYNKVTQFEEIPTAFTAIVQGTEPYRVNMEARNFKLCDCTCYLGRNNTLCKHIIAVALYALLRGKDLNEDNKRYMDVPSSSGKTGTLGDSEISTVKKSITASMRYLKPYTGPSRTWFAYQRSLEEGCRRLSAIISELPVCKQSTEILVNILLRLDRKLTTGGVDDSNGTVGTFIYQTVDV